MSKFEFNGQTWDIDMLDLDVMEHYEEGMAEVSRKMAAVKTEGKKGYEMMREEMKAVDEFFDQFLGDGTAAKMFGGSNSMRPRMEAFEKAAKLADEMQKDIAAFQRNTTPAMNRAQRRASTKKK
jgi:hypothetical protein